MERKEKKEKGNWMELYEEHKKEGARPRDEAKTYLVGSEWVRPIASYLDLDVPRKKILGIPRLPGAPFWFFTG